MTDEEVVQCKQVIYNLISLETKHEPLQMPNMGQRGKGPKRCVIFVSTGDGRLLELPSLFFNILLTVCPNIIIFFTNLMHKFLILIHPPTCFEHYCAHPQEVSFVLVQHVVSSLSLGDCSVHRLTLWPWKWTFK